MAIRTMAARGLRKIGRVGTVHVFVKGDAVTLAIRGYTCHLNAGQRETFEALYAEVAMTVPFGPTGAA